jgi:hypothetical protein
MYKVQRIFRVYVLVGGIPTPLKNMKVSWDYYSQYKESHKIHVPNHQPVILPEVTNYRFISDQPLCITSRAKVLLHGSSDILLIRDLLATVDDVRENMGHGMYPAW